MAQLTEKQKRFADYYIESGNATDSYKRAYGSNNDNTAGKEGHKLLNNPKVTQEIDSRIAVKDKERIADQNEVLEFLTSVLRGKETEKIPLGMGMGAQELVDNGPTIMAREKAAEMLGKRYGMWTDKTEHSGNIGVHIVDDIR
jgi:phage terminase small subunit